MRFFHPGLLCSTNHKRGRGPIIFFVGRDRLGPISMGPKLLTYVSRARPAMADLLGFSSWTNIGLPFFICLTASSTWIYSLVPAATAAATAKYSVRSGRASDGYDTRTEDWTFGLDLRILMENRAQQKDYLHYNHTDRCRNGRWTARFLFRTFSLYIALLI